VYRVDFTDEARKNISALSDKDRKKVQKAIDRILENPHYVSVKTMKLKGRWNGYYKYKIPPFRIFYRILGDMVRICYIRYRKEDTYK
jgi:addiction module RelE/StbE family toxin